MRVFVPVSSVTRALGLACALLLACGGLAEDGHRPDLESNEPRAVDDGAADDGAADDGAAPPSELRSEVAARQPELNAAERPESTTRWASVGDECEGLDPSDDVVVVGPVELRRDPQCGATNWCLRRAPPVQRCPSSVSWDAPACSTAELDFVAVPPPRAPSPAWQDNRCTCRCDGEPTDLDYCACPQGMRCAPLITSAGANEDARTYLGSYCVK
jgi:hypothetical protein